MRFKWILALLSAALVVGAGAGAAIASHVTQVDPATVPVGILAAHNRVNDVPKDAFKRVSKFDSADIFVQHARLGPNASTPWHTHPGPVLVSVVSGSLTYQDACGSATYGPGQGFVDSGFGHVHRAVAGSAGADFYATYILPAGAPNQLILADGAGSCDKDKDKDKDKDEEED